MSKEEIIFPKEEIKSADHDYPNEQEFANDETTNLEKIDLGNTILIEESFAEEKKGEEEENIEYKETEEVKDNAEPVIAEEEAIKKESSKEKIDAESRSLPETITINEDYLKQITQELGIIKLCWPELTDVCFEDRTNFPKTYLSNTNKEKLLLLYAENFRRQFCAKYPNRKPLILACDNECGMQKMVCTSIRPTTLPYIEIETLEKCAKFVADHLKYEELDVATTIPKRLYSPHTVFLRHSGHTFEQATALTSLLIGLGYDAYVVSGYAIKDVTTKIMIRVESPFPVLKEEVIEEKQEIENNKYKILPPKDLTSNFEKKMKQKELDKIKASEERLAELEREKILEEELRPVDELEGQRIHSWVLILPGEREIEEAVFIEPSTGFSHPLNTDLYLGIESIWNHQNYWVNLQDCSQGVQNVTFDITDIEKWEHLLVGEPFKLRKKREREIGDEEEDDVYEEKHLDVPYSWSQRIHIPHEAMMRRYPEGSKTTNYKRTLVEEYAPYVLDDCLVCRITRYSDFACTDMESIEETFENRHDKLQKSVFDAKTFLITEYFGSGREDSVIKHVYTKNNDALEAERTIYFNNKARFDGLEKVEIGNNLLVDHYSGRDDRVYYRQVVYGNMEIDGSRKSILNIIQKFSRNEEKPASEDIRIREFNLESREINLKYHYVKNHVTASTRNFIKPPISEMGEKMIYRPELISGYQAEIGAKPPRQLQLFLLLEKQLEEEKQVIDNIREFENSMSEFLLLRAHEMAFSKLDVSLYNREQNMEYKIGMLEQEEMQRMYKEKEVEEETDYLAPYLARLGNPSVLTYEEALDIKHACLQEFKQLIVNRANMIQNQFEKMSENIFEKQAWYTLRHEYLTPQEEAQYYQEVGDMIFYLRTLEMRLTRHKDLSGPRYEAMVEYIRTHPMLDVLLC